MNPIRVMLVDDHDVVRAGFSRLLESSGDIRVIGEARLAEEAVQQYPQLQPDVVIMDMSMPGLGGLEGVKRICNNHQDARVLVLTVHENEPFPQRAIAAGAKGYLTKRCAPEELLEAVNKLANGQEYYATNVRSILKKQSREISEGDALTRREFQIYELMARGLSVSEVADTLHLSVKTVHTHRANLMRKLDVRNNAELVMRAVQDGMLEQ